MKNWKILKDIKPGDFVVFLTILFVAVLSFLIIYNEPGQGRPIAVIRQHGIEIDRVDLENLNGRKEIRIDGKYKELIIAEKGKIRFVEADCPDKVCINTGWISKPGQVAACLPAGVVIKIIGSNSDEVDIYIQ